MGKGIDESTRSVRNALRALMSVLALAAFTASLVALFVQPLQLERGPPESELENAQKLLDDYRRKIESGK